MENNRKKSSVIGFIKYSQRNVNFSFAKSKKARDIFEPVYFNYRFNIFRNVTLKSFQEQSDMDFCLLLFHSESMPQEYKDRFLLLETENSFLHNVFIEDNKQSHSNAVKNSIDLVQFDDDVAVTFRIDNDDAISKDYIASLRKYVKKEFVGTVISIPNILIVKRHLDNKYRIEKKYYPANSMGLAFVSERSNYSTVLSLGEHTKANASHPMLLTCGYGGLQTINGDNVINAINDRQAISFDKEELRKYLESVNFSYFDLQCLNVINTDFKDSVSRTMRLLLPPILFKIFNLINKVVSPK